MRDLNTEVLRDEGYTVYEAIDGQRALERLETMRPEPDLVLSDIKMPRLTGFELAERIRQRRRPIPIVLMSANVNAPPDGGAMFLAKPFSLDALVALVERILTKGPYSPHGAARHLSVSL